MTDETLPRPQVYVVDDDRTAIDLYHAVAARLHVELQHVDSVTSLLARDALPRPACVIAELASNPLPTPTLPDELLRRGTGLPVIFVGRSVEVAAAIRVLTRGALTLLLKPLQIELVEQTVATAIQLDRHQSELDSIYLRTSAILSGLSQRQRSVLMYVLQGIPTKTIAKNLAVSQRLIELVRSELLKAFGVDGTADLMLKMGEYRILNRLHLRFDEKHPAALRVPVSIHRNGSAEESG